MRQFPAEGLPDTHRVPDQGFAPVVLDVVIPVYNEEHVLAASVETVWRMLDTELPYPFRITIVDNASTDGTLRVARQLASTYPQVRVRVMTRKGRGRALKHAWLQSEAFVLAYMDVDLSTDLSALFPLIAPLLSGHSDLAIGSRLARGAHVVRGPKREFISRSYNFILHRTLHARFSDAQCGFKAIRGDVARRLLPLVQDTSWFFDTELLVLAEWCSLRIHEVPVDWYDDPDSRVHIASTARDDLRGVRRLRSTRAALDPQLVQLRNSLGRLGIQSVGEVTGMVEKPHLVG
ncbi:glycosyltransferase family 2 protein [Flexivirga caeni]|uniref:dolichyl-phosphate beta-glucosyltransferase n=2 Tax=Flexivirga caeni TaxID=2294115 RepID=A0A3M9M337_9MICO|nr:glycosyltransferase family 2 protein [Flexivirga caeni]